MPQLQLALPWVPDEGEIAGLHLRRGKDDTLTYEDGITLEVRVVDPVASPDVETLLDTAAELAGPGKVVLVAGAVPVSWRLMLRENGVSFLDIAGAAEIRWPRLVVSSGRYTLQGDRRRTSVSLQQGHGGVVQELLIRAIGGHRPTIAELAQGAGVHQSTASRTVAQLARQGLVSKARSGRGVEVRVGDRNALARLLAERTAWPGPLRISTYAYGQSIVDVAARLSARAISAGVDIAVTGRVGAEYLGTLGTGGPNHVRCWVSAAENDLEQSARRLGLEPAPDAEANVILSLDRGGFGTHRAAIRTLEGRTAWVAHPLRVWCDLHDEPRGPEFAAQIWRMVATDA